MNPDIDTSVGLWLFDAPAVFGQGHTRRSAIFPRGALASVSGIEDVLLGVPPRNWEVFCPRCEGDVRFKDLADALEALLQRGGSNVVVAAIPVGNELRGDPQISFREYLELGGIGRLIWRDQLLKLTEESPSLRALLDKKLTEKDRRREEYFLVIDTFSRSERIRDGSHLRKSLDRARELGSDSFDLFLFEDRRSEALRHEKFTTGLVCVECGHFCYRPGMLDLRLEDPGTLCNLCRGSGEQGAVTCSLCRGTGLESDRSSLRLLGVRLSDWGSLTFETMLNLLSSSDAFRPQGLELLTLAAKLTACFCEQGFANHKSGHRIWWLSDGERQRFTAAYLKAYGLRDADLAQRRSAVSTATLEQSSTSLRDHEAPAAPQAFLASTAELQERVDTDAVRLKIANLDLACLREKEFEFPFSGLIVVRGRSGSGKTLFLREVLAKLKKTQGAPFEVPDGLPFEIGEILYSGMNFGELNRSVSLFEISGIHKELVKVLLSLPASRVAGFSPQDFSPRRSSFLCDACLGAGCGSCSYGGFQGAILSIEYNNYSINDLMQADALEILRAFPLLPGIERIALALNKLGLGSQALGRRVGALSPEEVQKLRFLQLLVKNDSHSRRRRNLYLFDDPLALCGSVARALLVDTLLHSAGQGHVLICASNDSELVDVCQHVIDFEIVYTEGDRKATISSSKR